MDKVSGMKWVNAAAIAGYSPAQRLLAQSAIKDSRQSNDKALAVFGWLRNASLADYFPAKMLLAWELSTSPLAEFRDGNEALKLLEADNDYYFDELRMFETKAAAYAELGDFKRAVEFQKKAKKIAKSHDWLIPLVDDRMGLYRHNEAYRGPYY